MRWFVWVIPLIGICSGVYDDSLPINLSTENDTVVIKRSPMTNSGFGYSIALHVDESQTKWYFTFDHI